MLVAAMTSTACVVDDVDTVLRQGLAVLPPDSDLAVAVREGAELGHSDLYTSDALDRLHGRYGHLHWVHVLNNAATVAFALTRGGGHIDSICLAVTAGWDTDSVGATVGAVCGTLAGASRLPARWTAPLHDRIATSVPGEHGGSLRALADRTCAVAR
jgi:ADP-ribosylglycohydrolase